MQNVTVLSQALAKAMAIVGASDQEKLAEEFAEFINKKANWNLKHIQALTAKKILELAAWDAQNPRKPSRLNALMAEQYSPYDKSDEYTAFKRKYQSKILVKTLLDSIKKLCDLKLTDESNQIRGGAFDSFIRQFFNFLKALEDLRVKQFLGLENVDNILKGAKSEIEELRDQRSRKSKKGSKPVDPSIVRDGVMQIQNNLKRVRDEALAAARRSAEARRKPGAAANQSAPVLDRKRLDELARRAEQVLSGKEAENAERKRAKELDRTGLRRSFNQTRPSAPHKGLTPRGGERGSASGEEGDDDRLPDDYQASEGNEAVQGQGAVEKKQGAEQGAQAEARQGQGKGAQAEVPEAPRRDEELRNVEQEGGQGLKPIYAENARLKRELAALAQTMQAMKGELERLREVQKRQGPEQPAPKPADAKRDTELAELAKLRERFNAIQASNGTAPGGSRDGSRAEQVLQDVDALIEELRKEKIARQSADAQILELQTRIFALTPPKQEGPTGDQKEGNEAFALQQADEFARALSEQLENTVSQEEHDALRRDFDELDDRAGELRDENDLLREKNNELREGITERDQAIKEQDRAMDELRAQLEAAESQREELRDENAGLQENNEAFREANAKAKEVNQGLIGELQKAIQTNGQLALELRDVTEERDAVARERDLLEKERDALARERDGLKERVGQLDRAYEALRGGYAALEKANQAAVERARTLEAELQAAKQQAAAAQQDLERERKANADLRRGLASAERGRDEALAKLRTEQEAHRATRAQLEREQQARTTAEALLVEERRKLADEQRAHMATRAERDDARRALAAERDAHAATRAERDVFRGERDAARAERDVFRRERDAARAERDAFRGERDAARVERDNARAELARVNDELQKYKDLRTLSTGAHAPMPTLPPSATPGKGRGRR